MSRSRATVKWMRWTSMALVALMVSSASARRRAPTPPKKHPAVAAIAKTALPPPETTKAQPNPYTNDPVLAGAARVAGDEVKGLVAFTFDDGPNPDTTPSVIGALQKYDIPATFFIVTRRIAPHEDKARQVLAQELEHGYMVGSHSVNHASLGHADAKKIAKEMDPSFETLSTETKRPIGLFRAPYGALNGRARMHLHQLGATEVFWSIDTLDWKAKDADKLRKKVLRLILKQDGGVVLMHDIRPITAKIIADVFDDLEVENCRRLAAKQEPIWPVSLHYFLREHDRSARPIPDDVAKRTAAYKAALPGRCAQRSVTPDAPVTAATK